MRQVVKTTTRKAVPSNSCLNLFIEFPTIPIGEFRTADYPQKRSNYKNILYGLASCGFGAALELIFPATALRMGKEYKK
jgi:hypothetical protein